MKESLRWFRDIHSGAHPTTSTLHAMRRSIGALLDEHRYLCVDSLLVRCDVNLMAKDAMVELLRVTHERRHHLCYWRSLFDRVQRELMHRDQLTGMALAHDRSPNFKMPEWA